VHTPRWVHKVVKQRIAVGSAIAVGAGLLLAVAGSAGAAPAPTLGQAEHRVTVIEARLGLLDQQYDGVQVQLASTRQRLKLLRRQLSVYGAQFADLREQITRIGVADYMGGSLNPSVAMLTTGDAQEILDKSSMLEQLSTDDNNLIDTFLAAARQLASAQQLALRAQAGTEELASSLRQRLATMNKMASQEKALVAQLTPAEQTATGTGEGGTSPVRDPIATTTQAGIAVKYAYDAIGCPYVYGGTGPCADGYDCSGLTMMSWLAAGIQIPRIAYEQWIHLTAVSVNELEPGDILVFLDGGHVALYVGNNMLIQAPQPGQLVQLVAFTGWFRENFNGAVRP
jgi:peptidoglycan DL-endopeptidase CwlO